MPHHGGKSSSGKKNGSLGSATIRKLRTDRIAAKKEGKLGFALSDLASSSNPLRSVTAASSMEEFMAVASMSNRTFVAERGQVSFVTEGETALPGLKGGGGGSSGAADVRGGTVRNLSIPRRPAWDGDITGEELHTLEKEAFLSWRRDVAVAELAHGGGLEGAEAGVATVTPFEKNIDVWRQLWRVVERCDVLIQIVDARNPLMYRCPDLEEYVREINPDKRCLLLLNKADFLSLQQRIAWAKYLASQGLQFAFFSARLENAALEELDRMQQGRAPVTASFAELRRGLEEAEGLKRQQQEEEQQQQELAGARGLAVGGSSARAKAAANMFSALDEDDSEEEEQEEEEGEEEQGEEEGEEEEGEEEEADDEEEEAVEVVPAPTTSSTTAAASASAPPTTTTTTTTTPAPTTTAQQWAHLSRILNRDELLDFLSAEFGHLRGQVGGLGGSEKMAAKKEAAAARRLLAAQAARAEELARRKEQMERLIEAGLGAHVRYGEEGDVLGESSSSVAGGGGGLGGEEWQSEWVDNEAAPQLPPLQVGMVGYPNVGKSSTINALAGATSLTHGAKRVAVGSTPGKTKHFQTIPLGDELTLCDAPGLVFPSFVQSAAEMVVNGILPIDSLKEHVGPVRLVCQRIPRGVLEELYGIAIQCPPGRQPVPYELLDALASARGFSAQGHGGLDHPRTARVVLKDYCDGRLCFAHAPPAVMGGVVGVPGVGGGGGGWGGRGGRGGGGVAFSDNVLLQGGGGALGTVEEREEEQGEEALEEELEEEEEEEVEEAEDDGEELTQEELLAFSRVVLVNSSADDAESVASESAAAAARTGGGAAAPPPPTSSSSVTGSTLPVSATASAAASARSRKQPGLGRHGSLKKGSRVADPYGTAAAADAAMRGDLLREVQLVSSGPAGIGSAGGAGGAALAEDAGATARAAAAVPKWLQPAPVEALPSTKRLNHVGGAQVQDPVPAGLRGQRPEGKVVKHFPKHLLAQALKLQEERASGGGK